MEDAVRVLPSLDLVGAPTKLLAVCPGAPFAERSLWINIAMLLWAFNIRKSEEPDPKTGKPFVYDDSDAAFSGEVRILSHTP